MKRVRWWIAALAAVIALGGCQKSSEVLKTSEVSLVQAASTSAADVKEAGVAGLFYPQDKAALGKMVDGFLAAVKPAEGDARIRNLRGLVVPHAGYQFSGPVAAVGYKQLVGRGFTRVIVMGPSHTAVFAGAYVSAPSAFRTPLGLVPVAGEAAELAKRPPFSSRFDGRVRRPDWWRQSPQKAPPAGEDRPDTWEHSLEVQLPFLQRTLKEFTLVPIVFGDVDPQAAARELAPMVDAKTLLVASSDLSHYEPYETARRLDTSCVQAVVGLDVDRMRREDACGKIPILTLMHVARQKGWKAKLLDYRNSGDTAGDKSQVVGYAAIAFYDEKPAAASDPAPEAAYSSQERKFLLGLARKTLTEAADGRKVPAVDGAGVPEKLKEKRACFVTLTVKGELRGCIGHILPQEALYGAVIDNAASAALRDPRFRPVAPEEVDGIHIEISVLTVPAPLKYRSPEELLAKLRPRVDGVVLQVGRGQATYLPQVWEQIADKEAFMSHLAEKAGLPADAWRSPAATVLLYQVEAFEEGGIRKSEVGTRK